MNTSNRLAEIAERNTRSRIIDVAFAAMIALLMVLCLAGLRSAAAHAGMSSAAPVAADSVEQVADYSGGTCSLDIEC